MVCYMWVVTQNIRSYIVKLNPSVLTLLADATLGSVMFTTSPSVPTTGAQVDFAQTVFVFVEN